MFFYCIKKIVKKRRVVGVINQLCTNLYRADLSDPITN